MTEKKHNKEEPQPEEVKALPEVLPEGYTVDWRNPKDGVLSTPEGTMWVRRVEIEQVYQYLYAGSRGVFDSLNEIITHKERKHGKSP